ncbi:hypothetical protein TREMEDRAFT_30137 [Tremella mesenterica DSM 1558]|uniref:uncharacterized protein n=1 Tax=Tremella mesenterica (strain ATCC 24925 / CBS 8224 / DSM 1558 / NBRC 9311 / NRRL Y-6157 / RJB 2259-6 / UBC 559-6) TaxID=578456 RepID=UPI0003F4A10E|nr:uncharacterized protein TREMEDRAFT_30137 [Tremella mesenterica DSM 1558]EIW69907.1 hypothetical protein TREMEDRAFT_30137 [Tremella mesenterica DSM 1558]
MVIDKPLDERGVEGDWSQHSSQEVPSEWMTSSETYHSGDTDEYEMDHRPPMERTAIKKDIRGLYDEVMCFSDSRQRYYKVVDKLGEGTFSSVYLARDEGWELHSNSYWTHGKGPCKVALKKVLVTSSPQRIENEIAILESLRGCRNVSQLITAFREADQVIIVLPYHPSDDFRHFYRHMDLPHIRLYMRAILIALRDIHQRGIVHRDVKPANFLFDYEAGTGVLVDFGLAEERYFPPRKATCQHSPATLKSLHGTKTTTVDTPIVEQALYDARKRAKLAEGRLGLPHDDKRPALKANRAGTRGFRAPEVLIKCPDQTGAIDIWSVGIILLSILTQKFPIFNSSDDIEALMELCAVFGRTAMEHRTILSNVPTLDYTPQSLESLILRLNPHLYTPPLPHVSPTAAKEHIEAVSGAISLCGKLLRLDSTRRLTAEAALTHPFLASEEDETVRLLKGTDGKCGLLHTYVDGKRESSSSFSEI